MSNYSNNYSNSYSRYAQNSQYSDRGKTICLIDNSNVFGGSRPQKWRVDYQKLFNYLQQFGPIFQTYFFASKDAGPNQTQENFYGFIRDTLRWEVMLYDLGFKHVRCHNCDYDNQIYVEKGLDTGIVTKLLTLSFYRAFDTAILVAGDRDYAEAIKFVKSQGQRIEIVSWAAGLSEELKRLSSCEPMYLDDMREYVERSY